MEKDKDLIAHVSLFGAAILDRVLNQRALPFLPGGPATLFDELSALVDSGLIVEAETGKSRHKLTRKGRIVCKALWGEEKSKAAAQ